MLVEFAAVVVVVVVAMSGRVRCENRAAMGCFFFAVCFFAWCVLVGRVNMSLVNDSCCSGRGGCLCKACAVVTRRRLAFCGYKR